ncbi:zinc/manganese transport system substrate-binding protein [Saccharopolyspora antimicrobica]|uniref:Zinc/manganese transport system substrate-binding protein n=1 Tax=Saccharopolyspora antimicrobica TaxID=455193 RepID=A0A1I5GB36_9PSEU|nr:zinc ABC transporter substrate-binding protein [Saccharopolyspora antimicrobica]RKT83834.1 zinc/manganese transport system substrate-binding protein [Saccharopolyspora antimicrobica]SFO33328.1 zinc/manganese transport system substrate-binding protein [Saccharopolyspora antimicrobica]
MTSRRRSASTALAGLAAAAVALTACGTGEQAAPGAGDKIKVVASTSVWGSVAQAVGGDAVEVESIVSDPNSDPHSYESTPRDAAKVTDADLVVYNGGGYDSFIEQILGGSQKPTVAAVKDEAEQPAPEEHAHGEQPAPEGHGEHAHGEQPAPEGHGEHAHGEQPAPEEHGEHAHDEHGHEGHDHSANEHVWYDLHVVHEVADQVATELGKLQPAKADQFRQAAGQFETEVGALEGKVGEIAAANRGKPVIVTEPVAHYLVEAAGLQDVTPQSFVKAIEAESDPSAAAVAEIQNAINAKQAVAVIYNPQTESPVTRNVRTAAEQNRIPVVEMTETLPEGKTYVQWMDAQIAALQNALTQNR